MPSKPLPPVIDAVLAHDLERVRAALDAGADVDAVDGDGRTALHHAAIDGGADVAELLLDRGADPNAMDGQQWTPLHFAAREHHVALAEMLLRRGASIDAVDSFGNTPLFRATFDSRGRGEMIATLLRAGADPSHANKRGVSPAKLAATIANYDVKRWFPGA
jgi:uncharacterized protein